MSLRKVTLWKCIMHNTVSLHTAYRQYFSVESLRSNSVQSFAFQLL